MIRYKALSQLTISRHPAPLKSGHIGIRDAQCAETNQKTIFRFLSFKIWSIMCSKFSEFLSKEPNISIFCLNRCAMFWNAEQIFRFFVNFSF